MLFYQDRNSILGQVRGFGIRNVQTSTTDSLAHTIVFFSFCKYTNQFYVICKIEIRVHVCIDHSRYTIERGPTSKERSSEFLVLRKKIVEPLFQKKRHTEGYWTVKVDQKSKI
jgi:hypothetical protein